MKIGIQKNMDNYCVYIMASKRNGTIYVGSTSDLAGRVYSHKNNLADGFTKKYGVHVLVYYEACDDRDAALLREKQIKDWRRYWKLRLIEQSNPDWEDLYEQIVQ